DLASVDLPAPDKPVSHTTNPRSMRKPAPRRFSKPAKRKTAAGPAAHSILPGNVRSAVGWPEGRNLRRRAGDRRAVKAAPGREAGAPRSEEHTSELQSREKL